jgi:hypothetical protein
MKLVGLIRRFRRRRETPEERAERLAASRAVAVDESRIPASGPGINPGSF